MPLWRCRNSADISGLSSSSGASTTTKRRSSPERRFWVAPSGQEPGETAAGSRFDRVWETGAAWSTIFRACVSAAAANTS